MDQTSQLRSYIKNSRKSGLPEDAIRDELLHSGWSRVTVDSALTQHFNPHLVRNGVLWILSPFIVLIGVALIQLLFRYAGVHSAILNIFSILGGLAGIILLPLGPILGIIKLSRH